MRCVNQEHGKHLQQQGVEYTRNIQKFISSFRKTKHGFQKTAQ
jgi:hypothetical protein